MCFDNAAESILGNGASASCHAVRPLTTRRQLVDIGYCCTSCVCVCVCVRAHARLFNQNSCDKQSNVRLRAVRCVNAVELAVEATEDQGKEPKARRVQRAEELKGG